MCALHSERTDDLLSAKAQQRSLFGPVARQSPYSGKSMADYELDHWTPTIAKCRHGVATLAQLLLSLPAAEAVSGSIRLDH